MTRLCLLFRDHPDAVEADLSRFHQIRWRHPAPGARLTFTEIAVRLRYLPPDAATEIVLREGPHWSIGDFLLDDIRRWYVTAHTTTGDPGPHYLSPLAEQKRQQERAEAAERESLLDAARRRKAARAERLARRERG